MPNSGVSLFYERQTTLKQHFGRTDSNSRVDDNDDDSDDDDNIIITMMMMMIAFVEPTFNS